MQILRRHAVEITSGVRIASHQRQDIVGRYLLADAGHAQERSQGSGNDHRVLGGRDVSYGARRFFGRRRRSGRGWTNGAACLGPASWALAKVAGGKKESGQANNWLHSGRLFEKLRDLRQLRFWVQTLHLILARAHLEPRDCHNLPVRSHPFLRRPSGPQLSCEKRYTTFSRNR